MARKPVTRKLPQLAEVLRDFSPLGEQNNKKAAILEQVRRIAQRQRTRQSQPFYAMREMARYFKVSIPTIAAVYQRLEQEGVLVRVRGSQTNLKGLVRQPRSAVRGVVAVPIYLPAFLGSSNWQAFYVELEEKLRSRGFVADFIFYSALGSTGTEFAERILAHHPDEVLILAPQGEMRQDIHLIQDKGVRVICIGAGPDHLPGELYRINWTDAFQEAISAWRDIGIQRLIVPTEGGKIVLPSPPVQQTAADLGLPVVITKPDERGVAGALTHLGHSKEEGVVFHADRWYWTLCSQVPGEMVDLFRRARVLLTGLPKIPPLQLGDATVDFLELDWRGLARQVADDLHTGRVEQIAQPVVYKACWLPRCRIADRI